MNLKILALAAVAAAIFLPATSDAQGRYRDRDRDRDYGRYDHPWRGNHSGYWNQTRYDRVRTYDRFNNGWPYGYPRDYRWPYGRTYNLGTGRLWTPRGADVIYINGIRVYLPR